MPWQQQVADVAWELDPENPGALYYTEGDVTVPRQSGKSDLINAFHTAGAIMFRGWRSYMTAQTGKDASKRWASLVADLPLADNPTAAQDWKINRGKGAEVARFLPRGGEISLFAPTLDSIHGEHTNFITFDEIWAYNMELGVGLETAAKPSFLTVKLSQLFRASTMGTASSTYMNHNIELGRQATRDPNARRFYFEWSADEAEADRDPYSDKTLSFHPAIGYTQTARKIRDLGKDMPLGEWRRSFLNLPTQTTETCIDLALFDSRRWNYDPERTERYKPASPHDIVLAWDTAADGSAATIIAAWLDDENTPCTELAITREGTNWLIDWLEQAKKRGYRAILADDSLGNRTIAQTLTARCHYKPKLLSYREYCTACQTLLDRISSGDLEHDGAPPITQAISNATLKRTSSASIFDAGKSAGPIDPLRALAIAQDAAVRLLKAEVFQLY